MPSFQSPDPISGRPCAPFWRLSETARTQCSYRRRALARARGALVHFVLVGVEQSSLEKRHLLVEDRVVAGGLHVLERRVDQPQPIVGNARPNALAVRFVPPVLHVAFDELARGRVQQMRARRVGRREQQGQHVLQLIAETERAAGLIERRASPDSARRASDRAASGSTSGSSPHRAS